MTLKSYYFDIKDNYDNYVVLIKFGNFYRTFNKDTLIMNYLFNYKISEDKVGFPIKIINNVISKLNENNINVIIVNRRDDIKYYKSNEDHYYEVLELSKKNCYINKKIEEINIIVNELINCNFNNYYKIKDYLDEL